MHYFPISKSGWNPPVILTSSITKLGFDEVYKMLCDYEQLMKRKIDPEIKKSFFELRRDEQSLYWFEQSFMEKMKSLILEKIANEYNQLKGKILSKELTPFDASEQLLEMIFNKWNK